MKNGDTRSAAWIARQLKIFKRDNAGTQTRLMLVDIEPTPSLDEINTWSDAQCLLADDWALAMHFSASDNNNRVPAVPTFLLRYQRRHPRRTAHQIAAACAANMAADNGCCFHPTPDQLANLIAGIDRMMKSTPSSIMSRHLTGCNFTEAEIDLFSAGEETEMRDHFKEFDGFAEAHAALCDIFDNAPSC